MRLVAPAPSCCERGRQTELKSSTRNNGDSRVSSGEVGLTVNTRAAYGPASQAGLQRGHRVPATRLAGKSCRRLGRQRAATRACCRAAAHRRQAQAAPHRAVGRARMGIQTLLQPRSRRQPRQPAAAQVPLAPRLLPLPKTGQAQGQTGGFACTTLDKCQPRTPKKPQVHDGQHCAAPGRHGGGPTAHVRQLVRASPQQHQRTGESQITAAQRHHDRLHIRAR